MSDNQKSPVCNNREDLVSYLYGETTPEQAGRVEAHLAECSRCDDELAGFRRVRSALQEWELDDVPIVRVSVPARRRSPIAILRELFGVAPIWAKAFSVAAAGMFVLAVLGTDISIGQGGFHFRTQLLGRRNGVQAPPPASVQPRADVKTLTPEEIRAYVNQQILESERAQKEQMIAELAKLEAALKNTHSNDFAKLAVLVQQQRDQIKNLERDVDRRSGLDFSDILFTSNGADRSRRAPDNSEGGQ